MSGGQENILSIPKRIIYLKVFNSLEQEKQYLKSHLFATHLSPTLLKHWDLLDETYQTRLLQSDIENISFYV